MRMMFDPNNVSSSLTGLDQAVRCTLKIMADGRTGHDLDNWRANCCNILSRLTNWAVVASEHFKRCNRPHEQFRPLQDHAEALHKKAERAFRKGEDQFWSTLSDEVTLLRDEWAAALTEAGAPPPLRSQPVKMSAQTLARLRDAERIM